ncbi:Virulence sensor protein BvgS precursor [Planctomyces sp. SH-PL14]|nr:Virulence sensor protein BvgS precursor [Planctomyces sp. SH-PL14]
MFHWPAIAGAWAPKTGGGLPFDASPCGVVISHRSAQLFRYPERHYHYSVAVDPPICEALLEPFFIDGKPVGTIWLIAHDEDRRFDREDARLLASLGRFAGSAFQILRSIDALEPSNQRLAAIVEGSDDAIVSKDLNGIIESWNAGAEQLFGYPASEAVGRSITMLIPPDRLAEENDILTRVRRGDRIRHFETVRRRKDGSLVEISLTVSPIRNARGEIVGASKIARDVSEQKRIERELLAADRQKNEFLATLAHELRNPLAPIQTSLYILRLRPPADPSAVELQEMMERQVHHMVRLVDDLLEIARITTGKIDLRLQPVDIGTIVASAVETSRPLIDAAAHELVVSVPRHPVTVEGDPVRLSQVVSNLLNNAAKFTNPGGRIALTVSGEGSEVSITVRDNGIGIPPESLPDVLKMFSQVSRQRDASQGGLGIGLALVDRLVALHKGTVEALSDGEGRGSTFVVRLPRSEAPSSPAEGSQAPGPAGAARQQKVLIVDDNRDAAASLCTLLQLLGSDAHAVYSGEEALGMVEAFGPRVILLDLGMPGMSGFEVAQRVRQLPALANVRLIALTGWGQEGDRRRTRESGFDHHLVKPVSLDLLRMIMESAPA